MRIKVTIEIPDEDIISLATKLPAFGANAESKPDNSVAKKSLSKRALVLSLIREAKKGITGKTLQKKTGLEGKQISNIVFQLKKAGSIEKKAGRFYEKV